MGRKMGWIVLLLFLLSGCSNEEKVEIEEVSEKVVIGVSLPDEGIPRQKEAGESIRECLQDMGYEVELQFAENKKERQKEQIENMIGKGCRLLIVQAEDDVGIRAALLQAKGEGIPVIAYESSALLDEVINYRIGFEDENVGRQQGKYLIEMLGLEEGEGTYYIELFIGDLDEEKGQIFYEGVMEVLSPYIEGGNLMIGSGQREQKQVWIENGDVQQAKYRMKNIVASYYAGERNLDAVICATDSLALGVVKGLDSSYGGDWPIVTGQGCDKENEEILKKGKQTMSLYKDSGELIQKTGELVEAILYGKEIEEQRFGDFTVVTGENYKEIVR